MKNSNPFSYNEYTQIIKSIKAKLPILDYSEINDQTEEYCVIRHDIEFSLERALSIAKLEKEIGIQTSYFVQLNNNTYNALSLDNRERLKTIISMGHKIGLHYRPLTDNISEIESEIFREIRILENCLQIKIDRFSFHRPNLYPHLLQYTVKIDGLINCYDKWYFQYFDGKEPDNLKVKYISDSNHKWKYGHPFEALENGFQKLQILLHPFSWSLEGANNKENYRNLLLEKNKELIYSINSEISNFPINSFIKD